MITLKKVQADTLKRLQQMVTNPNFFPAWANTQGLAIYSQGQMNRWQTQGGSEGSPWRVLNVTYEQRKKRMYGGGIRLSGKNKGQSYPSYFGSGTKTLIATSRLLASVLPPQYRGGAAPTQGEEFRKTVTDNSLELATAVPYATYVDDERSFVGFPLGGPTRSQFSDSFKKYFAGVR